MRHRLFGAWPTKAVLLAGLLALALGLITLFVVRANRGPAVHVVTSAVTEGPITRTVMTTGILAPAKTVDVGAQVSGTVEFLGADFNSRVRAGDVLARLDPRPFDADLMQATAAVVQSEGDLARLRVLADDARVKLSRAKSLASTDLIAPADLDTARVADEQAAADLKAGDAALQSARARVDQARINRAHTIIRSPIDGVVVNRLVEVGQTLNAAVNAPILFTIADLRHMLLLGEINEGEMGAVRPGAPVTFEIESDAGQQHTGTVNEVRLQPVIDTTGTSSTTVPTSGSATGGSAGGAVGTAGSSSSGSTNAPAGSSGTGPTTSPSQAQTSQATNAPALGVVTYTAVVNLENPDGAYAPGGTGLMTFVSDHRDRAVRIPNNAITFRPTPDLLNSLDQEEPPAPQHDPKDQRPGRVARVWTFKDGRFDAVTIRVGVANDSWTELLEGSVRPGDQLVTQATSK
jgi:RND family efflux transporter MFP subunit